MADAATLPADDKLEALEALRSALASRLAPGLTVARDNPGKTPQAWSVRDPSGKAILIFGLMDRTFFWTWDGGDSNHYAKSDATMRGVILGELARFGHLDEPTLAPAARSS
jgi:hypothetical protein